VTNEPLDWLEAIFADVRLRAPFAMDWAVDRRELPMIVTVRTPRADSTRRLLFDGDDTVLAAQRFASDLQVLLQPVFGVPLPPCPFHGCALEPTASSGALEWRCPANDFACAAGDYSEALWPPSLDEPPGNVAMRLGSRFHRRQIGGLRNHHAEVRNDRWVVSVTVRPDADEAAISAAAAPIAVEFTHIEAVRTLLRRQPATERERACRELLSTGGGQLAALNGTLRRASPRDDCDFLVEQRPESLVRVQLGPEHRIGALDEPVILAPSGEPFADDGDEVVCGGGYRPRVSRVEGEVEEALFYAHYLKVFE
jgi:hypothetical protein